MARALLRNCAHSGCPELVEGGYCPIHRQARERQRGSASARGYTSYWRDVFTPRFIAMLIAHDIAPVCGASLPGGPSMRDSRCRAEGRLNDVNLHLDHDPPLRLEERLNRAAVCDPLRVGFLCAADHSRKTQRERQGG